jgi:hypothetical protein
MFSWKFGNFSVKKPAHRSSRGSRFKHAYFRTRHVLKILSNQPFLQELAEKAPAAFDKAIAAPPAPATSQN